MSSNALTELSKIEASLWAAADQLRANSKLTSSEYCIGVGRDLLAPRQQPL